MKPASFHVHFTISLGIRWTCTGDELQAAKTPNTGVVALRRSPVTAALALARPYVGRPPAMMPCALPPSQQEDRCG
jgi:hypothetical protein